MESQQESQILTQSKDSPRGLSKLKLFAFVLLPVSVWIFAYLFTPSDWGIRTRMGIYWSLCCLLVVFTIGVFIVDWRKLKSVKLQQQPVSFSLAEGTGWFLLELIYWLVFIFLC